MNPKKKRGKKRGDGKTGKMIAFYVFMILLGIVIGTVLFAMAIFLGLFDTLYNRA